MARADHAFLDVVGRVFGDLKPGLRRRQQRDGARMAEFERGGRILVHEGLLDRDGPGRCSAITLAELAVQHHQPQAEPFAALGRDHAMGDMGEPRAVHLDHAPAHTGQAGIEAEDANRQDLSFRESQGQVSAFGRPRAMRFRARNVPQKLNKL